uniref:DM2 domain-containing protein n=1 Tax=viral metagenome TaxID=1070528 RepID=A0A6C0J0I9_9ZZZZ
MVRASKTTENTPSTATKAKTTKKATKTTAPESAPAPPVTNELTPAPAEVPAVIVEPPAIMVKMAEFSAKLQQLVALFSNVKSDFKTLEKAMAREMKAAAKASSKKRRNNGNRKPSGFVKPTRISDELANFLGKEIGSEMARTEVSKEINAYIQSHSLQDKKNGRIIHPDAKLTKLLKVAKEDELTYFNLQRYMKHHFQKAGDIIAV